VAGAGGHGDDALGDLALEHHRDPGEEVVTGQQAAQDRGTHGVGQVRGHLPRRFAAEQPVEGLGEGVAVAQLEPAPGEAGGEARQQALVELHREHPGEAVEQRPRQGAAAGTDLEHSLGAVVEQTHDALGHPRVGEEVLAQPAALGATHASPRGGRFDGSGRNDR